MEPQRITKVVEAVPVIKTIARGGDVIINERCTCGHLQSAHGYGLVHAVGSHHGACSACECEKYTWKEFVTRSPEIEVDRVGLSAYADSIKCNWEFGLDCRDCSISPIYVYFRDRFTNEVKEQIPLSLLVTK